RHCPLGAGINVSAPPDCIRTAYAPPPRTATRYRHVALIAIATQCGLGSAIFLVEGRRSKLSFRTGRGAPHRHKRVLEHVVRHTPALSDARGLVERPVDAEVDSALPVLFFGLRKRGETACDKRTRAPIVVPGHAV